MNSPEANKFRISGRVVTRNDGEYTCIITSAEPFEKKECITFGVLDYGPRGWMAFGFIT